MIINSEVKDEVEALRQMFVTVASACQAGIQQCNILLAKYDDGDSDAISLSKIETMGQG